jgi:hypothetical protein
MNGLSVPIEELINNNNNVGVLTFDSATNGIVEGQQTHWFDQREKECIQLTFDDGRTLVCTNDHLIRTTTGDIKAGELVLNTTGSQVKASKVISGVEQPLFTTPTADELKCEAKWSLTAGEMKFKADTPAARARSMIFCRIVGFLLTDGTVNQIGSHVAVLGHQLDVTPFINDIKALVPGDVRNVFDGTVWKIYIPLKLSKAILALNGMVTGARINQHHQLPDFVNTLPKSLLREFLGGLFGGGGSTLQLSKRHQLGGIAFRARATVRTKARLITMINEIKNYVGRFGVDAMVQRPKETSASKKKQLEGKNKEVEVVMKVYDSHILQFGETIGFRYCVHKQNRLSAGITWRRLQSTVQVHNNKFDDQVFEVCGYEAAAKKAAKESASKSNSIFRKELKIPIKEAYNKAMKYGEANGSFLSSFINIAAHRMPAVLKAKWEAMQPGAAVAVNRKSAKYFTKPSPHEWLTQIGALQLFDDSDDNCNDNSDDDGDEEEEDADESTDPVEDDNGDDVVDGVESKVPYAVPRENTFLPTWTLTVVDRRSVGLKRVYDISVHNYHLFVANGIVVHNCANIGIKSSYDYQRLLKHTRVIDNQICFHKKEVFNVYEMFHTRYSLFKQVYSHRASKAIEFMITGWSS